MGVRRGSYDNLGRNPEREIPIGDYKDEYMNDIKM
jgi:hypothetical protein